MEKREYGIDNVKVVACILVVLGHLFQSLVKSNILYDYSVLKWFEDTIYLFHVPLFFVCSGYIYQRFCVINTFQAWKQNVIKKLIVLGIPYITFTLISWLLKTIFASSVNKVMTNDLLITIFISPTAPYWFLYTLFFVFLITPTFKHNSGMIALGVIAIILRAFDIIGLNSDIFFIDSVLINEVWFVLGMILSFINIDIKIKENKLLPIGIASTFVFVILSIISYINELNFIFYSFIMGLFLCLSIFITINGFYFKIGQNKLMKFMTKFTMPIFLLHTICAAPLRIVLLKVGIDNWVLHIILGISISIVGPVVIALLMEKVKWMNFFIYPGRYIKL